VILERFHFYNRNQTSEENIADYIVALKHLATTCEFGTFLEDALRDRFVSGISIVRAQKQMLEQEEMTFQNACKIALNVEAAEKQARLLQGMDDGSAMEGVNAVKNYERSKFKSQVPPGRPQRPQQPPTCYRCGGQHLGNVCPYITYVCNKCSKVGHLAKVCKNRAIQQMSVQDASSDVASEEPDFEVQTIYTMSADKSESCKVSVLVENLPLEMMLDTGAACSIISENTYTKLFSHIPYEECNLRLRTYSGESLDVLGQVRVNVKYHCQECDLPLIVVKSSGQHNMPPLLGRSWMSNLKIDWENVFTMSTEDVKNKLLVKYPNVFQAGLSPIKKLKASIVLKSNAVPVFCKARSVPYALLETVEKELDRLEQDNVIRKVKYSNWATPLVVVPKAKDASDAKGVRLCGDFKVTLNKWVETEHYPLPNSEDLFASLAGGKVFTVLDLRKAYHQLEVNIESQELLTINTHRGLYRYNRLPYGICSAPSIFQSVMDRVLQGLKGVKCYLDDLLIVGESLEDCYHKVEQVLERLNEYNIKLQMEKCRFFLSSVNYLGYRVDSEGNHPTEELVEAIVKAPEPKNVQELKSYLGLLTFYGKFIPNLATLLSPLYRLLHNNNMWNWSSECKQAFKTSKDVLISYPVLVHYDSDRALVLACDASPYGVGAVISHVMDDGTERPIAFASRTLSKAEEKYPQLEREALSIIFGVIKFHKFLYGRNFVLLTDHRPLTKILNAENQVPTLAASRMQRWALILSAYRYDIVYRKGADHGNADALSRLPIQTVHLEEGDTSVYFFADVNQMPLTVKEIQKGTSQDKILSKVVSLTLNGWPDRVTSEELKPYFTRRLELTMIQDCVMWGQRVIIPNSLRGSVLSLLHDQHPGMTRMKMLARSYVWWPNMDSEIEQHVRTCETCQQVQKAAPAVPLHPWPVTERNWQRIHMDFAKKDGHVFFIIIDSYSKWVEVFIMGSTTAEKTIAKLRTLFSSYGMPEVVVSDNGPPYQSEELKTFFRNNGIKFLNIPPGHAQSNGAAERAVQVLKTSLLKQLFSDKLKNSARTMQHHLDCFLIAYRNTPSTVTEKSPADLFLNRRPRTRLALISPRLPENARKTSEPIQGSIVQTRFKMRNFRVGDNVLVRSARREEIMWWPGTVKKVVSPVTYVVRVRGQQRFFHADHLKKFNSPDPEPSTSTVDPPPTSNNVAPQDEYEPRRSSRIKRAPNRLMYY
jgi:transposase InsO family protein